MLDIRALVRKNIFDLIPYSSARDEYSGSASVFLDANENPYNDPLNRYPDPQQKKLRGTIAELKDQQPENLFLGNGSDEGIDLLFRVLCEPGIDNVIIVNPTYGMYGVCARINNVEQRSILLESDFRLNADAVIDAVDQHTKMIFLCSPNNPTSNSLEKEAIIRIVRTVDCMVIVDEAYIDFSQQTGMLSQVPGQKNLVVLQTLSKAWGLAGIRLGMVFAHDELINYLSRVKYPYNISTLTLKSALESLSNQSLQEEWVNQILTERKKLAEQLNSLDFVRKIYPTDANFLLVKMDNPLDVYNFLMKKGIIVRDRSSVPLCEGCLRITVGTKMENGLLCEALVAYNQNENP